MSKRGLLRRLSYSLIVPLLVVLLPLVAVIQFIPTASIGNNTGSRCGKSSPPRQVAYYQYQYQYSVYSFSIVIPNSPAFISRYKHLQKERWKHHRQRVPTGRIEQEPQFRDGSIQSISISSSSSSSSIIKNSNGNGDTGSDSDWFDGDHEIMNIKEQQAFYENTVFKSSMLQHVTNYLFQLNHNDDSNTTNATSLTASLASDASTNDRNTSKTGGGAEPVLPRLNVTTTRYMEMDDDGIVVATAFPDNEGPTTTLPLWLLKKNETSDVPRTNELPLLSLSVKTTPTPTTTTTTYDIATTAATANRNFGSDITAANMDIPADSFATFMIAIPIRDDIDDENGVTPRDQMQLLTEVESIQRAITYHCPILQPACIATTTTTTTTTASSLRIPLLSVTVPSNASSGSASIVHTIQQFVQEAISNTLKITNAPITVSVSKLGIQSFSDGGDGDHPESRSENEMLYTLIDEPIITKVEATSSMKSTHYLHAIIDDIFQWLSASYPSWSIRPAWDDVDANTNTKQLRLPIMRLPFNWNDIIKDRRKEENSPLLLTSDQGGNGISPIFWISYSEDVLVPELTLRQIAVYPGIHQKSLTTTSTNDGRFIDDRLDERFRWSEMNYPHIAASVSLLEGAADSTSYPETTTKTIERHRLPHDDVDDKNWNSQLSDDFRDGTDGNQRERIMNIIESRAQNRFPQQKRTIKVPGERNPIFDMYRSGALVPPQSASGATTSPSTTTNASPSQQPPPFPHRELAVGFWSMIRSPTGIARESDDPSTHSSSDNLILRVDGSIAGGPILDPVQRHKAAGGSWRYMEPEEENNNGRKIKDASLQIRFIIPPKKDRVMVMEGQFQKLSTLSNNTSDVALNDNALPVKDDDATYVCSGNVWIEDATTDIPRFSSSSVRDDIGTFTIVKILNNLSIERNSQLTITIPKNVRYID